MNRQTDLGAQLSDLVQDPVIGVDEQFRVKYWNPAAEHLFGWSADEAAGQSLLELLQVVFVGTTLDEAVQAGLASGAWYGQTEVRSKHGRRLTCENRATLVADAAAGAIRWVVSVGDISDRVHLEEQFKSVVESAMDGIVTIDE